MEKLELSGPDRVHKNTEPIAGLIPQSITETRDVYARLKKRLILTG